LYSLVRFSLYFLFKFLVKVDHIPDMHVWEHFCKSNKLLTIKGKIFYFAPGISKHPMVNRLAFD